MKKLLIGSELFFLHAKDCSDGQGMPARNVFMGCVECSGAKGCPRNGRRGATCSAAKCKADYAAGRRPDAAVVRGIDIEAPAFNEMMPSGTWIQELDEILGERCCVLAQLTKKKRKNGPGTAYAQQYLCRGKYLEEDGDEDDDDDDAPEPNTYWIDEADLLETIAKDDVKAALVARHERVLADM